MIHPPAGTQHTHTLGTSPILHALCFLAAPGLLLQEARVALVAGRSCYAVDTILLRTEGCECASCIEKASIYTLHSFCAGGTGLQLLQY